MGFSGVQNFPTVGLIDGIFRANLEETGMSYGLEVEMIAARPCQGPADHALCVQRRRCGRHGQGRRRHHRLPSGADHRRLDRGETALKLDDCPGHGRRLGGGGAAVRPDDHRARAWRPGGEPADAAFIMKNTRHCHGFYGASSMERLPVEVAIREQTRNFKAIGRQRREDGNGWTGPDSGLVRGRNRHDGPTDRSPHSLADRGDHRRSRSSSIW